LRSILNFEERNIVHLHLLSQKAFSPRLTFFFLLVWIVSLSPLPAVAENVPNATQPDAFVFDLKAGEVISLASLVNKIDSQDIVLLGELHDNPAHHLARAHIIELVACVHCVIVSEHLPANHQVNFSSSLLGSLESAGFDAKGWAWPLHEPLFKAIQSKNIPLMGGNIPSVLSSDLFKRGEAAIPASLLQQYQKSALSISAQKKLDQDLKEGHCGHLSDPYLPPMRLIQRIKDASFAELLLDHSPSIL